jgi:hypothetical protein
VSNFRSSIASPSTAPERKRRLGAGAISFYAARMLCQSAARRRVEMGNRN